MAEPDQNEREDEDDLTDEELAELDAASAEAEAHPETLIPWEVAFPNRAKLAG